MALLLDAGALIAYERADRTVVAFLTDAQRNAIAVRTTTGVVAQVWRHGARQARLARLLEGVEEQLLDGPSARRVGELLAASATVDVVDGSLIDLARSGDEVLTTDSDDLTALAVSARKQLVVVPIST